VEVIKSIFLGTLRFEILDDKLNWLLLDELTKSPIRAVAKDPILTTAFWSEHWASTKD